MRPTELWWHYDRMPVELGQLSSIHKQYITPIIPTTERKPIVIVAERKVKPQCSKRKGIFRFFDRAHNNLRTDKSRKRVNCYSRIVNRTSVSG